MTSRLRNSSSQTLNVANLPINKSRNKLTSSGTLSPRTLRKKSSTTKGLIGQSKTDSRRIVVEKWDSGVIPISAKMTHNVVILDCSNATVNIMSKVNHVLMDNCNNVTLRVNGVISQVEIVHCKNVSVVAKSKLPVIQIDMTDTCRLYFQSETLHQCRIIHASSPDIQVYEGVNDANRDRAQSPSDRYIQHEVPFSIFNDQQIVFFDQNEDQLSFQNMNNFKKDNYFVIP